MIIGIDASRAFVSSKTGTENYSYYLIKALLRLPESSQHIFVLFIRPNSILPDWTLQKNVIIRTIKLRYLWTQVGLALETWKQFSGKNYLDILWVPAHTLPVWRNATVTTVVTIHGLEYKWLKEYHNFLQRWYLPLSTYYAARSADRVICVSQSTKRDLLVETHIDPQKISVIYEGVEKGNALIVGIHPYVLERYGLIDHRYVLFVGTVQPRKNLVALIEAFARLRVARPDLKLVIAGQTGWDYSEVLRAPTRLGISDGVVFSGRVSDEVLRSLYLGALVYVQPSLTEGFGLPAIEAMRYGVPTIVSDGGALGEIVGGGGIIVPLTNDFVGQLAKVMQSVVGDNSLRRHMVSAGKKQVQQFRWEKAAKQTLKVLVK